MVIYGCTFMLLSMMGTPFTVWAPRPVGAGNARGAAPLLVILALFGAPPAAGVLLSGVLVAVAYWLPGWELPVMLALLALLLLAFEPLLRLSARYLARNRERLVERLAGAA